MNNPIVFFIIIILLIGFFYLTYYYSAYFKFQQGMVEKTDKNICYFDCVEEGFLNFPFCVKKNKCEKASSVKSEI